MSVPLQDRLLDFPTINDEGNGEKRGMPKVKFFEDISAAIEGDIAKAPSVMRFYNELHGKFQVMCASMLDQKDSLTSRLKSLKEAQDVVRITKNRKALEGNSVMFKAADCLYTRAKVVDMSSVLLWLGSNVLLEYPCEEGLEVLENNEKATEKVLIDLAQEIQVLKEQVVLVEVAISRLHNYIVVHKKGGNGSNS